jgi:hypothetical protein
MKVFLELLSLVVMVVMVVMVEMVVPAPVMSPSQIHVQVVVQVPVQLLVIVTVLMLFASVPAVTTTSPCHTCTMGSFALSINGRTAR